VERGVLMRSSLLTSLFMLLLVLLAIDASGQTPAGRQMLLVTGAASPVAEVSGEELRRAFLAMPVTVNGVRLRPVMNESDNRLTEVFLQKVMFMSHKRWERQVLSRIFRQGGQRPRAFEKIDELADVLRAEPAAVSFMWAEQFEKQEGLRSLSILWQEAAP